jgi:hypothetical protein
MLKLINPAKTDIENAMTLLNNTTKHYRDDMNIDTSMLNKSLQFINKDKKAFEDSSDKLTFKWLWLIRPNGTSLLFFETNNDYNTAVYSGLFDFGKITHEGFYITVSFDENLNSYIEFKALTKAQIRAYILNCY